MEKNVNRLPIVDADGKPVGIVTRSDLVNSFCMLG
jgi:CBS domain-containing protein